MGAAWVETLPVSRFHGVGPVSAAKMARLGIETGADLHAKSLTFLRQHFGSPAISDNITVREDRAPHRSLRNDKMPTAQRWLFQTIEKLLRGACNILKGLRRIQDDCKFVPADAEDSCVSEVNGEARRHLLQKLVPPHDARTCRSSPSDYPDRGS
jgi:nucleotidyltransferase/DNA polymerase involved in DNA repair